LLPQEFVSLGIIIKKIEVMLQVRVEQEAISVYLELLKMKFGDNLGKLIEELLLDSANMVFEIPEQWDDKSFQDWAKMDLEWNAEEEGEEVVDVQYVRDLYKSNLYLDGIEEYFI
jgi:hypothetical protein